MRTVQLFFYITIVLNFILIYGNWVLVEGQNYQTSTSSLLFLRPYHNSDYSINLQIPLNWEVTDENNGFRITKEDNEVFVDVSVHELDGIDLNTYVTDSITERRGGRDNFKVLELGQADPFDNFPAMKGLYTFQSGQDDEAIKKVLRYWIASGDKIYSIGYVSPIISFESNASVAQKIIDSLRIEDRSDNFDTDNSEQKSVGSFDLPSNWQRDAIDDQNQICNKIYQTCGNSTGDGAGDDDGETAANDITERYFHTDH